MAKHPGQPIGKRYLPMRRPEIYQALLRDIDGDLKASVAEAPELR